MRARTRSRQFLAWLTAAALLLAGRVAFAQDRFEIQVYRADVNEPGHFGLELHSNGTLRGFTTSEPPEIATQGLWRETLEPSYGVSRWLELGAYLQFARATNSAPEFGGVKLRSKFRILVPEHFPLQFVVNVELSYVPARFEANVWGGELRTVIAWHPGHWDLALNPILSFDLTGRFAGIPQFEPAAVAVYEIGNIISVGMEYYGAFGPVTQVSPLPLQGQYLFGVVNVLAWRGWEVNLGVGGGLTAASNSVVVKSIVGHEF